MTLKVERQKASNGLGMGCKRFLLSLRVNRVNLILQFLCISVYSEQYADLFVIFVH